MSMFGRLFGVGTGLGIFLVVILAIIFIFEIWMFFHAILNKDISDTRKVLWVIGMVLLHPIVAIAYYFTDYQKVS